jgi:stage IV sporulation protein FB
MNGIHVFTLFRVPVSISIWFIILVAYWGYSFQSIQQGLLWGGVVTFSILFHEFGHALVARRFRLNPSVLLHGWGGLCFHDRAASDREDALVVAAGPAASLTLGALTWVAFLIIRAVDPTLITLPLAIFYRYMMYVNVIWGLLNLLPLWPLDGGQLFRLGLLQKLRPALAEKITHITGLVIGVGLFLYAISISMTFAAVVVAFLAYQNFTALQSPTASGPIRTQSKVSSKQAKELLAQADQAYKDGFWSRAAQLAHQARALPSLSPAQTERVWSILTVTTTREGDYERALRYADRAKPSPDVLAARVTCLVQLNQLAAARALYDQGGVGTLSDFIQAALDSSLN